MALIFDYKDEASAQEAVKDEKIKGYLTIDQEGSVLKAVITVKLHLKVV